MEVEEEAQVQEMTLDEWKNLQEQTRPKPEFNIRKPESTVPSKAVVIHKSKYRDDVSMTFCIWRQTSLLTYWEPPGPLHFCSENGTLVVGILVSTYE